MKKIKKKALRQVSRISGFKCLTISLPNRGLLLKGIPSK